jgi:hypothetical protein
MEEPKKTTRYHVPFDYQFFKKLADKGISYSRQDTFKQIYQTNLWNGVGSVSGNGSNLIQTMEIARHLPILIKEYKIKTILDIPCGDFNWMSRIDLDINEYIGADIVEDIIIKNLQTYDHKKYRFLNLDLTRDDLPKVDLIFCRDCLVHFSYEDIYLAFKNIKKCGCKYILTTTFTGFPSNHDIVTGDWRPLNLELSPFNLPEPIEVLNEKCTEGDGEFADKSLGLWLIEKFPASTFPI